MGDGKEGTMVIGIGQSQNPIEKIQVKFEEMESGFKIRVSKQSFAVEAAVATATGAAQGVVIGGIMGTLNISTPLPTPPPGSALNPQALASLQQAQALAGGPLVQARNFAVMTGVNAGIASVMKRVRGKEDVESR